MQLEDSVAMITGASRGLGKEIAKLYAQRGARLVLVARDAAPLAELSRELGTQVLTVAADVGQDAEEIVERSLRRFGRLDVLVNNASTVGPSPMPWLCDLAWPDLERIFHTNVSAPLHLTQLILPQMRARKSGVVVNVTSDAAVAAYPGWGGYGTSKAALEHMTRILAAELDGSGIRVYLVDPGDMNTQMHAAAEPGVDLSHLPGPQVPAPYFVRLVEDDRPSGRFVAQALSPAVG